jgi:glutathione S-transferase
MKFFYANGTCAIGIHALLEELGTPYEPKRLDFAKQEQISPDYLAINPKGKVPAIQRDDGSVVTEFPAIATWLATTAGGALLPKDPAALAHALETIDYIVATVHMQGFTRFARPGFFSPTKSDEDAVKAQGMALFDKGLGILDKELGDKPFVTGELSVADFALLYVEFWKEGRLKQALPPNLARHYAAMKARPGVQAAMQAQGFA